MQDDNFIIENLLLSPKGLPTGSSHEVIDQFTQVSTDPENRIIEDFDIPKFFLSKVRFWFNIYTAYDENFVVIHDKRNLDIIYDVLDFRELINMTSHYMRSSLQTRYTLNRVKEIKESLLKLSTGSLEGDQTKLILSVLKAAKLKIPQDKENREKFFYDLAANMRAQTGQHGHIALGIKNFYPFEDTILDIFDKMEMPKGLLAISFLESSFNPHARSRAGAYGAWQFLKRTGRYFMKVTKKSDHRLNPVISTIGALHLLAQNKRIMKRWDMAVTAYNTGTKHLLRARRQLKHNKMDVNLSNIFTHYKHPHLGFASQNYYSEFLALVYTLAYREKFYPEIYNKAEHKKRLQLKKKKLSIFVTRCSVRPKRLYYALRKSSPDMKYFNTHLRYRNSTYPRGTMILSDVNLKSSKYFKIRPELYKKYYPKNFVKQIRNYSCSTR